MFPARKEEWLMRRIRIRPETYGLLRRLSITGELRSEFKSTGEIELDDEVFRRLDEKREPGESYDDLIWRLVEAYEQDNPQAAH
jgi:hypothetical protein